MEKKENEKQMLKVGNQSLKFELKESQKDNIGRDIFDSLNNKSLNRCKKSSRLWREFIDDQKFTWIRMIKKYVRLSNKSFPKSQELWRKMFCKTRLVCIQELAEEIHSTHIQGIS